MTRVAIRVGEQTNGGGATPTWLHTIGDHSGIKRAMRYPFGDWSLEWDMDLFRGVRPSALQPGRVVEAWLGGTRIFGGIMDDPDWESMRFSASGFNRQAESAHAVDFTGKATSNVGDAIYFAAARGAFPVGTLVNFGDPSWLQLPPATEMNTIAALLDQWCTLNKVKWTVDSNRQLSLVGGNPTEPRMFVATGEDLGVTTDVLATHVAVGYERDPGLEYTVRTAAAASWGNRVERMVDLTDLGPIADAAAQTYADDILARSGAQAAFTGTISVSHGQVTNGGGTPMHMARVLPGRMARLQAVRDPRNSALTTDVVIGETVWDEDAGPVQMTPLGADRQDFQAIVESIGGRVAA